MGRRALVIASQCKTAGHLEFLPGYAEELYGVLTDANLGGASPR